MVATRGRTFKRPWRRSCLSSKLKSSSAPIGRKDSWCFHAVGSSNAPLRGSTAAEGLPRIGRTSIATRWRSCGLPQSASCSENFVIPPDVSGQTLRVSEDDRGCCQGYSRRRAEGEPGKANPAGRQHQFKFDFYARLSRSRSLYLPSSLTISVIHAGIDQLPQYGLLGNGT